MIIEKVRLFSTKPLKGKFGLMDKFQIYPDQLFTSLQDEINKYSYILEIRFEKPISYTRFSSNYGSAYLEKIIIEFCHVFTLFTKFYT